MQALFNHLASCMVRAFHDVRFGALDILQEELHLRQTCVCKLVYAYVCEVVCCVGECICLCKKHMHLSITLGKETLKGGLSIGAGIELFFLR